VVRRQLEIKNELGLHLRAAARWVQTAQDFDVDLVVSKGEQQVNGKSVIDLLLLALTVGSQIEVVASGPDAAAALDALEALLERKFFEGA
jgi:phosphocarrier protein